MPDGEAEIPRRHETQVGVDLGEPFCDQRNLGGHRKGAPRNGIELNDIEEVRNRCIRVRIFHVHIREGIQGEPLVGGIVAARLETLGNAEARDVPSVERVNRSELREVDWQELGGLHNAVKLVDVFRTLAHVVDTRVVQIRFDDMTQAIEPEPAALHLLEGTRHFGGNGDAVVRDGAEDPALGFKCRRGVVQWIAFVGLLQRCDFACDRVDRGVASGGSNKRSTLAVICSTNAGFGRHIQPTEKLRGERPLMEGIEACGGVVWKFSFSKGGFV